MAIIFRIGQNEPRNEHKMEIKTKIQCVSIKTTFIINILFALKIKAKENKWNFQRMDEERTTDRGTEGAGKRQ